MDRMEFLEPWGPLGYDLRGTPDQIDPSSPAVKACPWLQLLVVGVDGGDHGDRGRSLRRRSLRRRTSCNGCCNHRLLLALLSALFRRALAARPRMQDWMGD